MTLLTIIYRETRRTREELCVLFVVLLYQLINESIIKGKNTYKFIHKGLCLQTNSTTRHSRESCLPKPQHSAIFCITLIKISH